MLQHMSEKIKLHEVLTSLHIQARISNFFFLEYVINVQHQTRQQFKYKNPRLILLPDKCLFSTLHS